MAFDERQFRDALAAFPTGVAVITGISAEGERVGITVNSFNSVSLSPPLVLFSVARSARSFAAWRQMSHYAVNILSQDQEAISNRFARRLDDKWDGLLVLDGVYGMPLLPNALAAFECAAHAHYEGGDHAIFVGRVEALHTTAHKQAQPLIFFGGRYRRLDAAFRDTPPPDVSIFAGW